MAVAGLASLLARLASCSEQSCALQDIETFELTGQFISHLDTHFAGGLADPLVVRLQDRLSTSEPLQRFCAKYLVGSVAISGKVDKFGLNVIYELCRGKKVGYLSGLLDSLVKENGLEAVAQFIAANIGCHQFIVFKYLISDLIKKNWNDMDRLVMRSFVLVRDDTARSCECHFILRHLPVGLQYEMIGTGKISFDLIVWAYPAGGADPLLREIFFLARCSANPNPRFRQHVAGRFAYFRQSLVDHTTTNIVVPCPGSIPVLTDDALCYISVFLDVETLILVLPLVCKSWRNLHPMILRYSTTAHSLYLLDLKRTQLSSIHTIMPWKYCLRNETSALRYFGQCMADVVLCKLEPKHLSRDHVSTYMEAVMNDKIPPPEYQEQTTQYDSFVKLFAVAYEVYISNGLVLKRPRFLGNKEYKQAVYYFVYEKKWIFELDELLIVKMPELFGIIKEDEDLMKKLIPLNYGNFAGASVILILSAQSGHVPEKLTRLVFSQTSLFKALAEPELIPASQYYDWIVESDILPELIVEDRKALRLRWLLYHLSLSLKNSPGKIDKVAESMNSRLSDRSNPELLSIKWQLHLEIFGYWLRSGGHPAGDIEFFKATMLKWGLLV